MSFTKVNPPSWAVGDELTSAQMNKFDTDHVNSLDKSSAGDTIGGVIHVAGIGQIHADVGLAIQSTASGGIQSLATAGFITSVAGGFSLGGGPTDFPVFSAVRSRNVLVSPQTLAALPAGWSAANGVDFVASATGTSIVWIIQTLHNGATLSGVYVGLVVSGPHGALPAQLPTVQIRRIPVLAGSPDTVVDLSTTPSQSPNPATAAIWDNGGNVQFFLYTCNQNNVIDTFSYRYFAVLTDENGANSVTGNRYIALGMAYTNIVDMRFP